jgi:hypothetical protein
MDEYLSIQLLLYRMRPITRADVYTYYPEARGRRLERLKLLAEHHAYFIEGSKQFLHLIVAEFSRSLTKMASSFNEFEASWHRGEDEATEAGQRILAFDVHMEEAIQEMGRVNAWCKQKMEEASRFL